MVVTDNASNMKHAFETTMVENDDEEDEDKELEAESGSIEMDALQQWTAHSLVGLVVLPIKYSWLSTMGMTS